jgi:hypothetical protein
MRRSTAESRHLDHGDRKAVRRFSVSGLGVLLAIGPGCGPAGLTTSPNDGANGADGSGAACSTPVAPVAVDAGSSNASEELKVEAYYLNLLDQLFGPYLRGDVPVYRGTAAASMTITSPTGGPAYPPGGPNGGYPPYPEQVLSPGPVLAALYVRPVVPQDWEMLSTLSPPASGKAASLVVHGLAQDSYTVFVQADADPTTTATDGVANGYGENLLIGSCSNCAPDLFALPPSIDLDLSTVGSAAGDTDSYSASANLAVVSPCSLAFSDLTILNGTMGPEEWSLDLGLSDFVLSGGDWVRHVSGTWTVKAASPVEGLCDGEQFNFSIDLYVDNADLGNYGVRNYTAGPIQPQCWLGPA